MAMGIHISNWPPEFICPISGSVMADPVIVSSGQTYERRCIEAWMDLGQSWCVKQSIPLDRNLVIPNTGLKAAISNMAKSKGMRTLPLPPSPELAYALARRLIQELAQPNSRLQEPWCPDLEAEDESGYDEEREEQGKQIHSDSFNGEDEDEEEVEDGDIYETMESLTIAEERGSYAKSSHPADSQMESSANEDERRGNYIKSSSSLHPVDTHTETLDIADEGRGNHLKSSSTLPRGYARAGANLEQGFAHFRASERNRRDGYGRYSRTDGCLTNPIRYSHSASGETLLEASHSTRELPPHLATKPSSYSSSESPHTSRPLSSSSSSVDPLVQRLQNQREEEQDAAVSELRQLTRASENRLSLCRAEIIQSLLPLFKSKNPDIQVNAVAALVNLSLEKPNKVAIVRAGAVRALVEVLNSGFPEAQEHAAGAAFSLALADENKHPMGVLNVIPPLIQLVHAGPSGSRQDAAMALYHLSLLQANKTKLVKVGAVPTLLNLAESKERPDMASRALLILSNVASIPEGRATLLQLNAITILVSLLAIQGNRSAAAIPEQAAAVLVLLSKGNLRFRTVALNAGALELLTALVENGTTRAREKASALLAIMKESSSGSDEPDADSVLSRQYLRMRVDGGQMNSSAF